VSIKGIDMALLQEPWYHEGHIRGLNIPGYDLFFASGTDRPHACILATNAGASLQPGFSCRYLVTIPVKYNEDGAERRLVVCSAYLSYDSEDPPPSKELEKLVGYCENENPYLIVGCDSNAHIAYGTALTATVEGKPWWNL